MKAKVDEIIKEEIESLERKIKIYQQYKFAEENIRFRTGYWDSYDREGSESNDIKTLESAISQMLRYHEYHGGLYLESYIDIDVKEHTLKVYDAKQIIKEIEDEKEMKEAIKKIEEEKKLLKTLKEKYENN